MENQTGEKLQVEAAKEFLLADFNYFGESIRKNEETGETRVKFYITLVTAVLAALGALASAERGFIEDEYMVLICGYALLGLLGFGVITLFRILKRNDVTDEYQKCMDLIRDRFKDHFDDLSVLKDYNPFPEAAAGEPKRRKFGGLAYTVAAMNSLVIAGLIGIIYYPLGIYIIVNTGLTVCVLSFVIQIIIIRKY